MTNQSDFLSSSNSNIEKNSIIDRYVSQFDGGFDSQNNQATRNESTSQSGDKELVKDFYAVATDFYENGWGEMFHFGVRKRGMTHDASLRLHETYLALRMCLKPGDTVADFGCGIGGPARNIAQFVQCKVVGVTISEYQVRLIDCLFSILKLFFLFFM